jgi:hypothetical protein
LLPKRDAQVPPAAQFSLLISTATMSKPSSLKVFVIIVLSLVLLWAGVAVLIGVFALLVKLFGLS